MAEPVTYANYNEIHPLFEQVVACFAETLAITTQPTSREFAEHAIKSCELIESMLESDRPDTALELLRAMNMNPNLPDRPEWSRRFLHMEDFIMKAGNRRHNRKVHPSPSQG